MKKIGLTGSIASGKTFVAECFSQLGIPVFDADKAIHKLMEKDGKAADRVANLFPESLVDGNIDRKILREIVFHDPDKLKKLEAILHPIVAEEEEIFITKNKNNKFVLLEIPLLFEKNMEGKYDYIIVTDAAEEVRRQRALKREGMTIEKFEKVNFLQMDTNKKKEKADFVINTEYTKEEILKNVSNLLEKMKGK